MKYCWKTGVLVLCAALIFTGCAGEAAHRPDARNPVTITIWHYYNGAQQDAFSALVQEFNETVGKQEGIVVVDSSQASVSDLEQSVLEAAEKKAGAPEIPNIFAAYADTAFAVDNMGLVADLTAYFTDEEMAGYMESYMEEGRFPQSEGLKIFPIAKSTEVFMLNTTDWDIFAQATGASEDAFATFEGITAVAQQYYEWTDSLTPAVPHDGQAFFGRDAQANYLIIGARQLGCEIFSIRDGVPAIDFPREVAKKLWDNYYVPYIKGYFASENRFRSDDVKIGTIISFIGSSSGATFFPTERIQSDTESYPIEMKVYPCPQFEGAQPFAVQQGAGMVVTKSSDAEIYASVRFLKWFTQTERNIAFSLASGYLPVTKQGNDIATILSAMEKNGTQEKLKAIVTAAIETVSNNEMYTTKAFAGGSQARSVLEYSLADKAVQDRAAVLALLAENNSYEQAVAAYDNEANFDAWYMALYAELEKQMY